MYNALESLAFLPYSYIMDKWRFDAFSGRVDKDNLNRHWWKLRLKYQGISPPVNRSERNFDPGSKMHISANVPYMRYFSAFLLKFMFHDALCKIAGESLNLILFVDYVAITFRITRPSYATLPMQHLWKPSSG